MDATASSKVDAVKDVYAFFLKIENTNFPTPSKQKSTVIKYTKLPEFDYVSKGQWPHHKNLRPRQRRLITLEEPQTNTTRSLKNMDSYISPNTTSNVNNRKIVTISEDDEYDLHPKFSSHSKKSATQITNRAVETEPRKEVKHNTQRMPRSTFSKYSKEAKCSAKMNNIPDSREVSSRTTHKNKLSNQDSLENLRSKTVVTKDTRKTKSASLPRTSLSKNFIRTTESEQEMNMLKAKLNQSSNSQLKKRVERTKKTNSPPSTKGKALLYEMQKKRTVTPVIHVPLEEKSPKRKLIMSKLPNDAEKPTIMVYTKSDGTMDTEIVLHHDMKTGTDPPPVTIDEVTDMEGFEPEISYKYIESTGLQADIIKETFDKLDIPNVSLRKDKIDLKNNVFDLHSESLPNLQIPSLNITDNRKDKSILDTRYCKSTSYIISRSTLTYKTQQKINLHVVDNNNKAYSNQLPSQLKYPMSVVSVFKEEMNSKDRGKSALEDKHENKSSKKYKNRVNEIKSLNCSYVPNSKKLMKPSDIISTIRVNNGLLQSVLVCEQFQRELNFIDSFFESLQYLENCSLSEKCYKNDKIEQLVNDSALLNAEINRKNADYDKFFLKLRNGVDNDDSETMTSKNIFLLNILIRDEQRRAKNLLCVLKRREDALKDFTKSQILYLENKKRQENTDISALKKKQRGALLKLQHECGEMQRMRKALLSLSEKRKVALMKTKKDLELKLRNNVNVEHVIIGKKKLKRSSSGDRASQPVKCFDLSSSGCEDTSTSCDTSDSTLAPAQPSSELVNSAEKSIQTDDGVISLVERSTNTAEENFVAVDGGYLNILFQNLTLPQIFSGGKQYEVNEEALKNIVESTNKRQENWSDVVEKLVNQPKDEDEDKSSTPSTARSLVEEFEQYYKTLEEDDRSLVESELRSPSKMFETSDAVVQTCMCSVKESEGKQCHSVETMTVDTTEFVTVNTDESFACEEATSPAGVGPLPVPAGEASLPDPAPSADLLLPTPRSSDTSTESSASSQPPFETPSPPLTLEPSQTEAEELRRQQLAIEKEIKELEQQQCRMLAMREIPDKPPPPYTPPVEARPPNKPRPFRPDEEALEWLKKHVTDSTTTFDPTDAFEMLIHDFSEEIIAKQKAEHSDKPWDSCNLLPQKPAVDPDSLTTNACNELTEALTPATPSLVSGVSSRRSDHIDDILFAEWRRAEPEWTSLHTDEASVKNQLFETIFQRILTDTVDEYKKTVLTSPTDESIAL